MSREDKISYIYLFLLVLFLALIIISIFAPPSSEEKQRIRKLLEADIEACRSIGKPHVVPYHYHDKVYWRLTNCELK